MFNPERALLECGAGRADPSRVACEEQSAQRTASRLTPVLEWIDPVLRGDVVRILLIEDDPAVAATVELMLRTEDFTVQAVAVGDEGLALGRLKEHDLILLDLNLPDISGYDVLRSLRMAQVRTPILILSGLTSIENKVKGLGLGADDYLTKPFHKDE